MQTDRQTETYTDTLTDIPLHSQIDRHRQTYTQKHWSYSNETRLHGAPTHSIFMRGGECPDASNPCVSLDLPPSLLGSMPQRL